MEKKIYECKFCGEKYSAIYDNLFILCCKKGSYAKGHSALVKIGKKK